MVFFFSPSNKRDKACVGEYHTMIKKKKTRIIPVVSDAHADWYYLKDQIVEQMMLMVLLKKAFSRMRNHVSLE